MNTGVAFYHIACSCVVAMASALFARASAIVGAAQHRPSSIDHTTGEQRPIMRPWGRMVTITAVPKDSGVPIRLLDPAKISTQPTIRLSLLGVNPGPMRGEPS